MELAAREKNAAGGQPSLQGQHPTPHPTSPAHTPHCPLNFLCSLEGLPVKPSTFIYLSLFSVRVYPTTCLSLEHVLVLFSFPTFFKTWRLFSFCLSLSFLSHETIFFFFLFFPYHFLSLIKVSFCFYYSFLFSLFLSHNLFVLFSIFTLSIIYFFLLLLFLSLILLFFYNFQTLSYPFSDYWQLFFYSLFHFSHFFSLFNLSFPFFIIYVLNITHSYILSLKALVNEIIRRKRIKNKVFLLPFCK